MRSFVICIIAILSPVVLFAAQSTTSHSLPEFEGLLQPSIVVELRTPIDGLLENVRVDRGDRVTVGTIIATMESSAETAAMKVAEARAKSTVKQDIAKAKINLAKKQLEQYKPLAAKNIVAGFDYDQFMTNRELAELVLLEAIETSRIAMLEYKRLKALLEGRTVYSPINGVVLERKHFSGETLTTSSQDPIVKIAQLDPLYLELIIPVKYLEVIKTGMSAQIFPESNPSKPIHGTVNVIDPVVNAETGTFGVRLSVSNPDNKTTSGLYCKVRLQQ